MGDKPVDVVRSVCAALNDCDLEAMARLYDPDVVWEDLPPMPDQEPVVVGFDAVIATFRLYLDSFARFEAHLIDAEDIGGDAAIGTVDWKATGTGSGAPIVRRTVDVMWVRDGVITHYISGFESKDDGLRAISDDRRPAG